ncbi:MAG: cation:dicarboxylase symporter family transporter, partial [Firmicutes bacterium]|nr:cation:dicarboxylase symporter family transporter [Bacillota bacterium]
NCPGLKTVHYTGSVEEWSEVAVHWKGNDALGKAELRVGSAAPGGLKITAQPEDVTAWRGDDTAVFRVQASGEGLSYQWWFADPGKAFKKSSLTPSDVYETHLNAANDGRRIYCEVTDSAGNTVRSRTATLHLTYSLTIISHIWNGQISQFYGIWKPILVYAAGMFLMLVLMLNHTATKYGVEKKWLLKTLKPAMMTSFLTASAGASYGETESIVTRKFGVPSRLTEFALPIGQTMFMPATICSFIATAYYLTEVYHVEVDLTWMIVATIICTMMAIALPPIPGSGLACYAIMLGRLNIPAGGLGVAIVLDIIFTFIGRAVDCAMLQMELVNSSDALGVLDRKIIRRQK